MKIILYIATLISLVTYLFWSDLPKGAFYVGNAIFIMLLCMYLFFEDKKSSIKFFLLVISMNNLFDELWFDNTVLGINEIILGVTALGFIIIRKYE